MAKKSIRLAWYLLKRHSIGFLTLARRVLPEVLGLVPAEDASRLGLGGGAARELLVEVDYPLHPDGIGVGAKGLRGKVSSSSSISRPVFAFRLSVETNPCWSIRAVVGASKMASNTPVGELGKPYLRRGNLRKTLLVITQMDSRARARWRRIGATNLGGDKGRKPTLGDVAHLRIGGDSTASQLFEGGQGVGGEFGTTGRQRGVLGWKN